MNTIKRLALDLVLFPAAFADHYLSYIPAYRRLWGGHWERWCLREPVHGTAWMRMERCRYSPGFKRDGLMAGTPTCEDYRYPSPRPCDDLQVGAERCRRCGWPHGLHR